MYCVSTSIKSIFSLSCGVLLLIQSARPNLNKDTAIDEWIKSKFPQLCCVEIIRDRTKLESDE